MKQIVFTKTRTTRLLRRRVPLDGRPGGFTTVPDGEEEVYFSTEINLELLNDLGRRAARNRSQEATDGPLKVKVLSRRRLSNGSNNANT